MASIYPCCQRLISAVHLNLPIRHTLNRRSCLVKQLLPLLGTTCGSSRTFGHTIRYQSKQDTTTNQDEGKSFQKDESSFSHKDRETQYFTDETSSFQAENREHSGEEWSGSQEDFHDSEEDYELSVKQRILSASLNHVHELGWTNQALEAGATSEGLPSIAHGMFPRGGAEIIEYFYVRSNADLAKYLKQEVDRLKAQNIEKPKTRPFIKNAVEIRLKMILPYKEIWAQAMGIQTLPQNSVQSWKNLMHLADEIWHYAGDKSVDFNWYTKRFTLAAVYKASEIFMLQDTSVDHQATWEFLDRRLNDVEKLGQASRQFNQSGSVCTEGLSGFFNMGRNILGMNSRNR